MKRQAFLKVSLLAAVGLTSAGVKATTPITATKTNEIMSQAGYNHLPNQEVKTPKTVLHRAETRGHANHGWLNTHHTFSFANYRNPERMHFGALRVLNDDVVAPGHGFGRHPHDNMEIISIPLAGDLEHQDSLGNVAVIRDGDVQVMSAGTGVTHSEKNRNQEEEVRFLQIWMFPNQRNVEPRYDQIKLDNQRNELRQILSPNADDAGVWAHQNAWFHLGDLDAGHQETYQFKDPANGLYTFVLEGTLTINGQELNQRDGFGVWNTDTISLETTTDARVLLMEVPMDI